MDEGRERCKREKEAGRKEGGRKERVWRGKKREDREGRVTL